MKAIFKELKIDDELMKKPKIKQYDKIKDNIPLIADYNFMADLLILPKTKDDYNMLLVVCDLATDEFDIEPLKNKQPETVLKAMKEMFKRPHIKQPYASLKTDNGTEFKGVFHKYLYDNSILHKLSIPNRHKSMSSVENLNRWIGKIIMSYLNDQERKKKHRYNEWLEIIPIIRTKLNTHRKKTYDENKPFTHNYKPININIEPKFKINDIVYHINEVPHDGLGKIKNQDSNNFRSGDFRYNTIPKKIKKILYYHSGYRYLLENVPNVSYMEAELKKAEEQEEMYEVKKIIGKRKIGRKIQYLIWFKKELKKNAIWIDKTELIKDGLEPYLKIYDDTHV